MNSTTIFSAKTATLYKRLISFSALYFVSLFFTQLAISQNYNAVDWGTYFNDNAHYPSFNFQNDDAINQVVVDDQNPESVYVVGRTYSAPTMSLSVCGGAN